ncbi:MAG: phosphoribosyltransferase family protein [Dehalococcoidales bacterium]|nr:phosphoribosyltransferase family protein [Dehalococcoidales bacterium]
MQSTGDIPESRLRIISYSGEPFRDREQAGRLLAEELADLKGKGAVVLGIPRGGIIVAREIARSLDADLDIVLARKLGAPGQPELAMGSVAENGEVFLNPEVVDTLGVDSRYIDLETERQMKEIRRRSQLIRSVLPKTPISGRTVIVTDDGVATGATMQAALWAIRQENPAKLIAAIPVASEEALIRLSADADEVICLRRPYFFYAVGQFYHYFSQVDDAEVLRILEEEAARRKGARPAG